MSIGLIKKDNRKEPLYRNYPAKRLLPFMESDIENNVLHLFKHKIVREVGINSADKPFGTIAHPNIYDVGPDILLTNGSKGMTEIVLRYFFVVHNSLEKAIQKVSLM